MLAVTGWALATWAKITLGLGLAVTAVWWCGAGPGWTWLAALTAALLEVYVIRQLGREWAWQARAHWWWSR